MNVLGHTFVARAAGSGDPEFLLGAVLPDLAPMAGIRLARAGIGWSDRTDCPARAGSTCAALTSTWLAWVPSADGGFTP